MPFQQSDQPGVFGTEFCQFFGAGENTRVSSGLRHGSYLRCHPIPLGVTNLLDLDLLRSLSSFLCERLISTYWMPPRTWMISNIIVRRDTMFNVRYDC